MARRVHKGEVWAPLTKERARRWRPDYDAYVYQCVWTQDIRIQLLIVRDLMERQACALEKHAPLSRHHQVAKDAVTIMDCLLEHQPRWVVIGLSDCLAGGVMLFLDSVVGILLEAGPAAGAILERMGYRPYRASTILARIGVTRPGFEGQSSRTYRPGDEGRETTTGPKTAPRQKAPPRYRPATAPESTTTFRPSTPPDCRTVYHSRGPTVVIWTPTTEESRFITLDPDGFYRSLRRKG